MGQAKKIAITTLGVLVAIYVMRQIPPVRPLVDKALGG
jgi:hypothetical protein